MTRPGIALLCAAALAAALPPSVRAHEGHGAEAPPATTAPMPRLESEGSDVELVATAEGHTLTIYLDRSATNAPIDGATVEVAGEGLAPSAAKAMGDGVYVIEAEWIEQPGAKALTFTVMADGIADLLAGKLVVPQAEEAHGVGAVSWPDFLARPEVWIAALVIALGGFCLAFAFRPLRLPSEAPPSADSAPESKVRVAKRAAEMVLVAVLAASLLPASGRAHEGDDHGPAEAAPAEAGGRTPAKLPSGEVFLPKATQRLLHVRTAPAAVEKAQAATELIGTVIADPAYEGRVQAPMDGQIELASGEVSYVGKAVEAGEILALLAPAMPVYERGTLMQVTAEVEGKLRIAEQKLARLSRISGDYIPQREIDDTREEIASLREQKRVLEPKAAERMQLKAPVSGIISVATVRAGQVVNARDTLFEIVDPKRLWIEAIGIPGTDDEHPVAAATALDAEGHRIPLTFVGRAPALRHQALPLLFKVDEPHASLGIGAAVKVLIQHGAPVEGIVVPDAAVVRAAHGLFQVWIKVAPERFAPRLIRTRPLDGDRVLVSAGLAEGDRVVVEGAELINQVR